MRRVAIAMVFFFVLGLTGCKPVMASSEIFDINYPTKQIEITFKNDYELMKAIYNIFPSHKKNLLKLLVFIHTAEIQATTNINPDGSIQIISPPDRGIWMHELMHYFSNQLDSSDQNEFCHEVLENVVDGMSAETYKKYFHYNKDSIYRKR